MNNFLEKKKYLSRPEVIAEFQKALPKNIVAERFVRTVLTEVKMNEKLSSCTLDSILDCCLNAAQLGLSPGKIMGNIYLIPRKDKDKMVCTLLPGYKGLKEMAFRSGHINDLEVGVVYENDFFDFEFGTNKFIKHKPYLGNPKDRGEIIYFYACARLNNGGQMFDVMAAYEVEEIRNKYSEAYKWQKENSVWGMSFTEMGKKTVFRRLTKMLPSNPDLDLILSYDNNFHSEKFSEPYKNVVTVDAEAEETIQEPEVKLDDVDPVPSAFMTKSAILAEKLSM